MLSPEILADPVELTRVLVDVESVSGDEAELADQVETALRRAAHLSVERHGNVVLASTHTDRPQRVILAGHLDTVPIADNLPSTVEGDVIHGCGTADMKSGVALALNLAATVARPRYDVTYLFYDCEEVEAERNGLNRLAKTHPEKLAADFAILLEPTYGLVEAGCQGTMRAVVTAVGRRAHSARSWLGVNAIHAAGAILNTLEAYEPRTVTIDGCTYREGLNAVRIAGGVAGNVIPDECRIEINYRFAPDRTEAEAAAHVRELFADFAVEITDSAPAAMPGLASAIAKEFLDVVGQPPQAKLGWTDVARFAALGVPALNFGPGDPNLAHKRDERVEIPKIRAGAEVLRRWLTA
ncbi:succinyl-diaminopimelate desuccinylase [Planosporangium flavigriseum]|uniref:Succinyl-diaminopimelate desuccinylase n=1 Tax=Planosporangium flavigriseum TaxID=373681 RepID=A0A8J3PNW9_9ACTN|nr:succinyl-diaminopimelate desuccinylase [Planosporangium flavigriseum]NJC67647.1 succinyl-diaminopimelate desuccinylase [Planosporangium flavigriseum]GIG75784.1 succinyl-diaminopimelate desuccinylase [Planosporangium flavigriseum]